MIVMSRQKGERIVFGDSIQVEVIDIRDLTIVLEITSDNDCRVSLTSDLGSPQLLAANSAPDDPIRRFTVSCQRFTPVVINDVIKVFVADMLSHKVRIAIEAPNYMSVHRKEVYDAISGLQRDDDQG